MWIISVVAAVAIAGGAALVVTTMRRHDSAPGSGDGTAAPGNLGMFLAAGLALAASLGLALVTAWCDLHERQYQVYWLVLGPAFLGLAAASYALFVFGLPRSRRPRAAEVVAWLACLLLLGIGTCYGSMMFVS